MSKRKGPEFTRFFTPILEVLKELGGSGTTSEVIDLAIDRLGIPEGELEAVLKNGTSKDRNQAQWARLYLVKAGLLSSSERGVWALTEKGAATRLERIDSP